MTTDFLVPIYNVRVTVVSSGNKSVFKNPLELAKTIQEGNKIQVHFRTDCRTAEVIVHEAVHVAKAVMRIAGVKQPDEETEAYLIQCCYSFLDVILNAQSNSEKP